MRRGLRIARALVSAFLFAAALWILRDVLREYHYHEVVRDLRAIAPLRLATSFILTVLGYLALVGQDLLRCATSGARCASGGSRPSPSSATRSATAR
jgi:uncharacterized membrane protein YbhN (UPF0104 family)